MAARIARAAAVSVLPACTLVMSTEHLHGGAELASPRDAGFERDAPDSASDGFDTTASSCPSDALLCDGFEGPALGSWWRTNAASGSATLDTSRNYRGLTALHAHTEPLAVGASALARLATTTAWPAGGVYLPVFRS